LGKLGIFRVAFDAELYALALIGLANTVLAAYYYLRVIVYLFMREPVPGAPAAEPMRSGFVRAAVLLAALGVVVLGLSATPLEAVTASALLP